MELGSAEHKQLLWQMIKKTAFKTFSLGAFVGVILIIPSLIYSNTFSTGLAYGGFALIVFSTLYASYTAWGKYQKLIKPFDD